jgi:peptidyl-prolyl cis-trans isomerase SurA
VVGKQRIGASMARRVVMGAALLLSSLSYADVQIIDRIAAIVDDDVVMMSELQARTAMLREQAKATGKSIGSEEEIRIGVLDSLILESLQMQMAQRAGFYIDDNRLNQALSNIARQNGMDLPSFVQVLEENGQSYAQVREQVRKDMILQEVQRGNVNHRVQITEDEIENFLASPEGQQLTEVFNRVDHLLVPVASDANSDEEQRLRGVAETIHSAAQNGGALAELAVQNAAVGASRSDLGWRNDEQMPEIFRAPVAQMNKGDVSIVRSPSGFHVIQLIDRRGNEATIVPQTKLSHILIKPTEVLDIDAAKAKIDSLLARAKNGEDFAALAKEYSDDIGTAQEGGDLGWSNLGTFVPEFEQAMVATPVGEFSEPVRTQFGWHVLKIEGRRDEDVSDIVLRNRARGMIHERKYQEELEIWLQKTRDEAYVDIKI